MSDMIEHKQNGYLDQPFDVDNLSRSITWVMQDEERLGKLGGNGNEKVKREFILVQGGSSKVTLASLG